MSHSWSKQISLLVQADLTPGPDETLASLCRFFNETTKQLAQAKS